ncbi:MAG: hypothetical protein RML56_06520 [Burkholderiales bacterium]|nr:hypothetical protein [Burkholderiales bacterium]
MRIEAIGIGGGAALAAWADTFSTVAARAAGVDRLVAVAGSSSTVGELLGAIAQSGLGESTRVRLSEMALALFALEAREDRQTLGELAQALLIALILELLDNDRRES